MNNYKQYLTVCINAGCGKTTSKKYAREHDGQCKQCADPENYQPKHGPQCPDCGGPISAFQLAKGYHCDRCTRNVEQSGGIYGF